MTTLQLRMREELVRRDFSESTIRIYLRAWRHSAVGRQAARPSGTRGHAPVLGVFA